jgi:CelD/BcsL family acetyltransferase involved in cellulose biosynthesis
MMIDWEVENIYRLDEDLIIRIKDLWRKDPFSSPFSAPSFLEMMVKKVVEKNETPLFAKGYDRSGNLAALWPLRLDRSGCLCFLQFYLTDYNTALFLPWVEKDMLSQGLARAVEQIRPKTVFLTNVPGWGKTCEAAVQGLEQAGYRCVPVAYDKVPCVQGTDDPDGMKQFGRQFNKHRGLKNYSNRLMKMKGFHFEVDETPDDINDWVDQFCVAHDKRWETTSTPSKYQDEKTRIDLKDALKAWAKDQALIRFSVHVMNRRITFVVGLKNKKNKDIIYFHTARLPVYNKLSTGNITIRLMGLWMKKKGYQCLDFGRGDEAYKHYFANETRDLWRVYGARSLMSLHYWKGCIEAYVKAKDSRRQLWAMLDSHVFKSRWVRVFRRE